MSKKRAPQDLTQYSLRGLRSRLKSLEITMAGMIRTQRLQAKRIRKIEAR
jgi:hypothetical protein